MNRFVNRLTIMVLCALATSVAADAQVAKWIIRPVNMGIARMSNNHFKVWNTEKCGVFNSEGKQIVPYMADSITDFVDGKAVVLQLEDTRWRVMSVLHLDGTVYPVHEQCYVDESPFVAHDRLLVADKKGKDMFISIEGKKMKDKVVREEIGTGRPEPDLDFDADGPIPFEFNDRFGYYYGQDILLPAQFTEALPFSDGYAIAADQTGRYGLLRLLNDDISVTKTPGSNLNDYVHENIDFKVHVPIEFNNEIITVECVDASGDTLQEKSYSGGSERVVPFKLAAGRHEVNVLSGDLLLYNTSITATPPPKPVAQTKKPSGATPVTVATESYVARRSTVSQSAITGSALQIAVGARKLKANAKDCASFSITLTNNGSESVVTPVSVSGKGVVCSTNQLTVKPHSSRSFTATLTGIKTKEVRAVTVRTRDKSVSRNITVNPFFTEF